MVYWHSQQLSTRFKQPILLLIVLLQVLPLSFTLWIYEVFYGKGRSANCLSEWIALQSLINEMLLCQRVSAHGGLSSVLFHTPVQGWREWCGLHGRKKRLVTASKCDNSRRFSQSCCLTLDAEFGEICCNPSMKSATRKTFPVPSSARFSKVPTSFSGREKPFVKLRTAYSVKLLFYML